MQLPSLGEVARAIGSVGRYHFGIPSQGLYVTSWLGGTDAPYISAVAPLKEGDVYVASMADWLIWLAGFDPPGDGINTLLARLESLPRWARLLLALNYVPVKVRVPTIGGPMSYSPHGVLVVLGHFGSSVSSQVETWSCSTSHDLVGADVGAMPNTIGAAALEEVYDAWVNVISAGGNGAFSEEVWLDGIAYYRRQADGTSTTGTWERFISVTGANGDSAAAGAAKPLQIATVVTEDAGGARVGRFGRFYLPAVAGAVTLGTVGSTVASALVTNVAGAMDTVNTILNGVVGDPTETVVASAVGSGENRPVRTLRVGRVLDTQRRRRRDLNEDYTELPFQSV